MPLQPHTDKEYESELARLRQQILLMGAQAESMIAGSLRALVERDGSLARRVIASDRDLDQLELAVDHLCLHILALRQPVASDLRFITLVLKIVRDLERIGDLAVNVSERVLELNQEPPLAAGIDIPRLGELAGGMLRDALDALVGSDENLARQVIARDQVVDQEHDRILQVLLAGMMEDPQSIYRSTRLQAIAKNLERIADHATNVAEMAIFGVKGTDIRHTPHD
jgi:phosphate transport system protein